VPFGFGVGPNESQAGSVVAQLPGLTGMGAETVLGWVVGKEKITPIGVIERDVFTAVAEFPEVHAPEEGEATMDAPNCFTG
jgi:hypothetical protein